MKKVLLVLVLAAASLSMTTDANAGVLDKVKAGVKAAANSKFGKNLTQAGVGLAIAGLSGQRIDQKAVAGAALGATSKTLEESQSKQ